MGSDTPASAIVMAALSMAVPRFSAEMTPTLTPTTTQVIAAPRAREIVAGSRSSSVGQTGWLLLKEKPKHGAGHSALRGPSE